MNLLASQATALLAQGAVIAFPTETVYALACDATQPQAVEKLYELKGRDRTQPIAMLLGERSQIEKYAETSDAATRLIEYYMPGPLTLVLPLKPNQGLAGNINNGNQKTIGVRIPNHPLALDILNQYPHPLAATSANPSGAPAAQTAADVRAYFGTNIPLILEFRGNASGQASTVIDLTTTPSRILRKGAIGLEEIGKLVGGIQEA